LGILATVNFVSSFSPLLVLCLGNFVAEWPTNLDDVPMDAAPIAMETAASPWETNAAQQLPSESNWANFESSTTKKASKEDENWADFSGFSSIETSSNLSRYRSVQGMLL